MGSAPRAASRRRVELAVSGRQRQRGGGGRARGGCLDLVGLVRTQDSLSGGAASLPATFYILQLQQPTAQQSRNTSTIVSWCGVDRPSQLLVLVFFD
jgi:hypothetical protein